MDLPTTGNGQIDHGHGRLIALLEKLRYNPDTSMQVIQELSELLQVHFEEEEALMRAAKYRGAKPHIAEHRALGTLLTGGLIDELGKSGGYEETLRIVDRSRQVFMDHVLGKDHDLALYLVRKEDRAESVRSKQRSRPSRSSTKAGKRSGV